MGIGGNKLVKMIVSIGIAGVFMATMNAPAVSASTAVILKDVPWYQQVNNHMCGPASLQMVFDYYGPYISDQYEIAYAMRGVGFIAGGHFSDLSAADYFAPPHKLYGYTGRGLGYAAFAYSSNVFWLDGLKALIDQGYPIIVTGYWGLETSGNSNTIPASSLIGHARVVVGYDDSTGEVIVNDPWGRDMKHMGDNQGSMKANPGYDSDFAGVRFSYDYFEQLWSFNYQEPYTAWFIAPWQVDLVTSGTGTELEITATVTYPCPAPFHSSWYPASDVQIGLDLPVGLALAENEEVVKTFDALSAGNTVQVTWNVVASNGGSYDVSVSAQGLVHGVYGYPIPNIPYTDRIGGEATISVVVA
jgi:hypothetical protein